MIFTSAVWLVALLPFAAVVAYLLWGRRREAGVPFLELWAGPVKVPRPRRRFAWPPIALALAMLAVLLAILGAARPGVWDASRGTPVTIVVDRGATMSAGLRFIESASAVHEALVQWGESTPVELLVVPGEGVKRTDVGRWLSSVRQQPPTAVDVNAAVRSAVARRLAETTGPVVVISATDLGVVLERLVQIAPDGVIENAGIVLLAARESPRAQVMVRVRNGTAPSRAQLRVTTNGREIVRTVDLPRGDDARDYFVDFDSLGEVVKAELRSSGRDDFGGDDVAWLVKEGSRPAIEPRGPLAPGLRRMIDVYGSSRPPTGDGLRVLITPDAAGLPPGSAGVVVAAGGDVVNASDPSVTPHPVTRDTGWMFRKPVRLAAAPAGWSPVVSFGGRVAVAVRESPVRQVWVGIESDEWPRTPEYVVFWGNVFDWLGGAELRFVSHPAGRLSGAWEAVESAASGRGDSSDRMPAFRAEPGHWPGLYRRAEDGALRAVNAGDVRFATPLGGDWRPGLARVLSAHARGSARPLATPVFLAALACAALATGAWTRGAQTAAPAAT